MPTANVRQLLASLSRLFAAANRATVEPALTSQDLERILREAMRQIRIVLQQGPAAGSRTSAERLNRRRFAKRKSREMMKAIRRRPRFELDKPLLAARFRASPILDALLPDREQRWVGMLNRGKRDVVEEIELERFSFIEDPTGTLTALKRMAIIESSEVEAKLHFNDEHCTDIAPFMVLNEI